jgi:nucleotide-binding universal stress UspA family protein
MPPSVAANYSNPEPKGDFTASDPSKPIQPVVACLDGSESSHKIVSHAAVIARALKRPLTLLRVLEVPRNGDIRPDPVEWDIERRRVREQIGRLVDGQDIEAIIVEGRPAEQIGIWVRRQEPRLVAIGTNGESSLDGGLGDTARRLVEEVSGAMLLVPPTAPPAPEAGYRRVLVPLDGSCRAESVLPLAASLARQEEAELILVHVVPLAELTEIGPLSDEDLAMRDRIAERNERVARRYLDRLRAQLADQGVAARIFILRGNDIREALVRLMAEETADLVVLSAQGRTGRNDVACGSVASYLVSHAAGPLLLMLGEKRRPARQSPPRWVPSSKSL